MNRPDNNTLNSWLEGKLEGEELRTVEAWAEGNAGDLDEEFKCEIGWCALNDKMMAQIPKSTEPPYPDFFNSKLQQAILEETELEKVKELQPEVTNESSSSSLWQKLRLMIAPAAIAALVAFYAGTQMQTEKSTSIPDVASAQSSVYVPHSGIVADVSESTNATEIILNGLSPISDELDMAAGETSPGRSPMMANTDEETIPYTFF